MKKRILATVMAAAMLAMTACSGMPGMGATAAQTQAAAEGAEGGEAAAAADDTVYELRISTSQTEHCLLYTSRCV